MKKPWKTIAALMAVGIILSTGVALGQSEAGYWDKFKMLFVDWDDNAAPGTPKSEVAGVRGVGVMDALGDKTYDWSAIQYMEDFSVSMDAEKQFLKEGKLGPYQGK